MIEIHSKQFKTTQSIPTCHSFHPESNLRKFWKASKIYFLKFIPIVKRVNITIYNLFEASFYRANDFKINFRLLKFILNNSKRLTVCQHVTRVIPKVIWESFENHQKIHFLRSTPNPGITCPCLALSTPPPIRNIFNSNMKYLENKYFGTRFPAFNYYLYSNAIYNAFENTQSKYVQYFRDLNLKLPKYHRLYWILHQILYRLIYFFDFRKIT